MSVHSYVRPSVVPLPVSACATLVDRHMSEVWASASVSAMLPQRPNTLYIPKMYTHTYTDTSHRLLHLLTHLLPSAPEVAASVRTSWDGRRPTDSGSGSHYRRKQVYWTSEMLGRFWFSTSSSASWGNSVEMAIQGRCTDMICPPLSLSVASRTESTQKFTETMHTLAHTDKRLWATSQQKSFHKNILFCCHHSLLLLRAHWLLWCRIRIESSVFTRTADVCVCVAVLLFCRFVFGSVQFSEHHSFTQSVSHSLTHTLTLWGYVRMIFHFIFVHTPLRLQRHTHTHTYI